MTQPGATVQVAEFLAKTNYKDLAANVWNDLNDWNGWNSDDLYT